MKLVFIAKNYEQRNKCYENSVITNNMSNISKDEDSYSQKNKHNYHINEKNKNYDKQINKNLNSSESMFTPPQHRKNQNIEELKRSGN